MTDGRAEMRCSDENKIFLNLGDTPVMKFLIKFLHYWDHIFVEPSAEQRHNETLLDKVWNHAELARRGSSGELGSPDKCPKYPAKEVPQKSSPLKMSPEDLAKLKQRYEEKMTRPVDEKKCERFWLSREPRGRELTPADYKEFTRLKTETERKEFLRKVSSECRLHRESAIVECPPEAGRVEGNRHGEYQVYCTLRYVKAPFPNHVAGTVDQVNEDTFLDKLWLCRTILYDITTHPEQIDEAHFVLRKMIDKFEEWSKDRPLRELGERKFILISPNMTWALTKPLAREGDNEGTLIEEYYRKRRPHPKYKDHYQLENRLLSAGIKYRDALRPLVVCCGIVYGHGETLLRSLFEQGWSNIPEIPVFGSPDSRVPLIYDADLAHILLHLIIDFPKNTKYIFAMESETPTQLEVVKAVLSNLTEGHVKLYPPEASIMFNFEPNLLIALTTDLNLEPNYLKRVLNWTTSKRFIRDAKTIVDQYKRHHRLSPAKVILLGPQTIGKTIMAKNLCKYYNLTYISPRREVKLYIKKLNRIISRKKLEAKIAEEIKRKGKLKPKSKGKTETKSTAGKTPTTASKSETKLRSETRSETKAKKVMDSRKVTNAGKGGQKAKKQVKSKLRKMDTQPKSVTLLNLTPVEKRGTEGMETEGEDREESSEGEKKAKKMAREMARIKEKYKGRIKRKIYRTNAVYRCERPTRKYLRMERIRRRLEKADTRTEEPEAVMQENKQLEQGEDVERATVETIAEVPTASLRRPSVIRARSSVTAEDLARIPEKVIRIKLKGHGTLAEKLRWRSVLLRRKVSLRKKLYDKMDVKVNQMGMLGTEKTAEKVLRNLEKKKKTFKSDGGVLEYRLIRSDLAVRVETLTKTNKIERKPVEEPRLEETRDRKRRRRLVRCKRRKRRRREARHRMKVGKQPIIPGKKGKRKKRIKRREEANYERNEMGTKTINVVTKTEGEGTARWEEELGFPRGDGRVAVGALGHKIIVNGPPVSCRLITRTSRDSLPPGDVTENKRCDKWTIAKKKLRPEQKPKGRISRTINVAGALETKVKRYSVRTGRQAKADRRKSIKRKMRAAAVASLGEEMKNRAYIKDRRDGHPRREGLCKSASSIAAAVKFKHVLEPRIDSVVPTEPVGTGRKSKKANLPERTGEKRSAVDPKFYRAEYATTLDKNLMRETRNLLSEAVQKSRRRVRYEKMKSEWRRAERNNRKERIKEVREAKTEGANIDPEETDRTEAEAAVLAWGDTIDNERKTIIEVNILRGGEDGHVRGEFYLYDLLEAVRRGKSAAAKDYDLNGESCFSDECFPSSRARPQDGGRRGSIEEPRTTEDRDSSSGNGNRAEERSDKMDGPNPHDKIYCRWKFEPDGGACDRGILRLKINIRDDSASFDEASLKDGLVWKQIVDLFFGESFREERLRLEAELLARKKRFGAQIEAERTARRKIEDDSRKQFLEENLRTIGERMEIIGRSMEMGRNAAVGGTPNYAYRHRPNPIIIGEYRAKDILKMKPVKRVLAKLSFAENEEEKWKTDYKNVTGNQADRIVNKNVAIVKIDLKEEKCKTSKRNAKEIRKTRSGEYLYLCRNTLPGKYEEPEPGPFTCGGIIETGRPRDESNNESALYFGSKDKKKDEGETGSKTIKKYADRTSSLCKIYVLHRSVPARRETLEMGPAETRDDITRKERSVVTRIKVIPTDRTLLRYADGCVHFRVIDGRIVSELEWREKTTQDRRTVGKPVRYRRWNVPLEDYGKTAREKMLRRRKRRRRHLIRRRRDCRRMRRKKRLVERRASGQWGDKWSRRLTRQRRRLKREAEHRRLRRDLRRGRAEHRRRMEAGSRKRLLERYRARMRKARKLCDFRVLLLTGRLMQDYRRRRRRERERRRTWEAVEDIRRRERETARLLRARSRRDPRSAEIARRLRRRRRGRHRRDAGGRSRVHHRRFRRHRSTRHSRGPRRNGLRRATAVKRLEELRAGLPRRPPRLPDIVDLPALPCWPGPTPPPARHAALAPTPKHHRDLIHEADPRRGRHRLHGVMYTDLGYLAQLHRLRGTTIDIASAPRSASIQPPAANPPLIAPQKYKKTPGSAPPYKTRLPPETSRRGQMNPRVPSRKYKKLVVANINKIKSPKDKTIYLEKVAKLFRGHHRNEMRTAKGGGDFRMNWEIQKEAADDPFPKPIEYYKQTLKNIRRQLRLSGTVNDNIIIKLLRRKMLSKPSQNQGFILDSFPLTYRQAKTLTQPTVDENYTVEINGHTVDSRMVPDWIFTIEASDRVLVSNDKYFGHYKLITSRDIHKAMALFHQYRLLSNKLDRSIDFYEELNVYPHLFNIDEDPSPVFAKTITGISSMIGKPKTHIQNLKNWLKKLEKQHRKHNRNENNRHRENKSSKKQLQLGPEDVGSDEEHFPKKELVKEKERKRRLLEIHNYLTRHVLHIMTNSLLAVIKLRPDDPIDFMVKYILERNRAGLMPRDLLSKPGERVEGRTGRAMKAAVHVSTVDRILAEEESETTEEKEKSNREGDVQESPGSPERREDETCSLDVTTVDSKTTEKRVRFE